MNKPILELRVKTKWYKKNKSIFSAEVKENLWYSLRFNINTSNKPHKFFMDDLRFTKHDGVGK